MYNHTYIYDIVTFAASAAGLLASSVNGWYEFLIIACVFKEFSSSRWHLEGEIPVIQANTPRQFYEN